MSYTIEHNIETLKIIIPKADFPLKNNDTIIGHKSPILKYQNDECSFDYIEPNIKTKDSFGWNVDMTVIDNGYSFTLEELVDLCKKYNGTLIVESCGEDGGVDYTRIRDGKKKKVRIVEEE